MSFMPSVQLGELQWRLVPQRALQLAKRSSDAAHDIREAIEGLPRDGFLDIWYSPDKDAALINFGDWAPRSDVDDWLGALDGVVSSADYDYEMGGPGKGDWVKIATQPPGVLFFKRSYSPTLRALGSLGGYFPDYFGKIPGVPSPLAAMLASGMLGAGAGYGTGWALEKVMPENWQRGRLRRTLAILGGLGAAAPAGLWAATNVAEQGLPGLVSGSPLDTPVSPGVNRRYDSAGRLLKSNAAWDAPEDVDMTGAFPAPIDANKLIETIHTPPVYQQLSAPMRTATTGLAIGAGHLQTQGQGMPRLISPVSVGNMAAGMGSGWLSGLVVGKVLGALTGMPEPAQKRLRDTGLWAGAITNIIPLAFPGR